MKDSVPSLPLSLRRCVSQAARQAATLQVSPDNCPLLASLFPFCNNTVSSVTALRLNSHVLATVSSSSSLCDCGSGGAEIELSVVIMLTNHNASLADSHRLGRHSFFFTALSWNIAYSIHKTFRALVTFYAPLFIKNNRNARVKV